MRLRLHWRITLAYLVLISGLLLAAYLYVHFHLEGIREAEIRSQLERETQMVRALWEQRFANRPFSYQMDAWVDRLAPYLEARVTVIDKKGKVWADSGLSGEDLIQAENHRGRPEVQEALAKGTGMSLRYSATLRCRLLYVAGRLGEGGSPSGVVRLALSLSTQDRFYSRVNAFLVGSFLFALLFGVVFAYFLSRLLSRPILEIASLSQRMAGGDFSRKARIYRGGRNWPS